MAVLYHAFLKVHSPHGTFEGYLSDEPMLEDEALALASQYADIIHKLDVVGMKRVGGERSKVVFPGEVLRQSVLIFEVRTAGEPPVPN